jgi:putative heme-binding domain-containing protein
MMARLLLALGIVLCLHGSNGADEVHHGLRVPPGFEVTEFADSTLANDIHCLTLDPRGRVVVTGRGYIRLLLDRKGKGRADTALDFAGAPKDGAMGLFWEGDTLYCMGDGGLRRYRDANGAGRLRPPELLAPFKTGGEHAAHAIRRGPDGYLYVLSGNNTGSHARRPTLPTSPITEPVAGRVLRFAPDFKGFEIVADGFRNPYALDFNVDGELFTFDSDNERCVSLPWYEGTRVYHVFDGSHHGWQNPQHADTWRQPPYFLDVTAPVADLGRGSPTGVVCYKHVQYPEEYRGGLFLLDWTFGRIYFLKLQRRGSTYTTEPRVFLRSVGDNGFAPTAAAVHPITGDLFVSIGGRGTRGAVYRIRYPKGLSHIKPEDVARWQPKPRSLEWKPGAEKELLRRARSADLLERRRALALILRHRRHFDAAALETVIRASAGQTDRGLRQATAALLASLDAPTRLTVSERLQGSVAETVCGLAEPSADIAHLLTEKDASTELRLDVVRLLQRALGDLMARDVKGTTWEGYSRRSRETHLPRASIEAVRAAFPSGHHDLDRELARTLAMIEDDDAGTLRKVAAMLTARSHPVDDLHYLFVLARLRGRRSAVLTQTVATVLLALDRKVAERHLNRESNWPQRVGELYAELARKDPALNSALLAHADFGRPDHALFAQAKGFDRRRAAEVFVTRAARDPTYAWDANLVRLLGNLPEERALPVLRRLWGEQGLDEVILPLLARAPHAEDRARFVAALGSAQPATAALAFTALEKLPPRKNADELLALILAQRRLPSGKEYERLRLRFDAYLTRATGQKQTGATAWAKWYASAYPRRAARVNGTEGVDLAAWGKRLTALDWSAGDAGRGQLVFTRASCASCHSGVQALGPDLHGVTGRFSRADLFTAVLLPSKDVSPRYRTTQITTAAGKVYQGLIIYEAVDSVILQTGSATTLRLANRQVSERHLTTTSLMPTGLLDRFSDRDLADLYAYLRSLDGTGKKGG